MTEKSNSEMLNILEKGTLIEGDLPNGQMIMIWRWLECSIMTKEDETLQESLENCKRKTASNSSRIAFGSFKHQRTRDTENNWN
jgi:hypothetical protein